MIKKKIAIVGCGRLATIVAQGAVDGLLDDFSFIGCWSRSFEKANNIATIINNGTKDHCTPCNSFEQMMALKPDIVVETASPSALKAIAIPILTNGASIATLSMGAFADTQFYNLVINTAKENNQRVYIASGAIGGLDVLSTASLMGECELTFDTTKNSMPFVRSGLYPQSAEEQEKVVFKGSAQEAIALFPTMVNVAVAASIASVGPDKSKVSITSKHNYFGDNHRINIKNKEIDAVIEVFSKKHDIAGWSVINTLRNITSPIVF